MRRDAEEADARAEAARARDALRAAPGPGRRRPGSGSRPGSGLSASIARSWPLRASSAPAVTSSGPATPSAALAAARSTGRKRSRSMPVWWTRILSSGRPSAAMSALSAALTASSPPAALPAATICSRDAGPRAPEMDVAAARLDREGHAERRRQPHRRRAVGPEEFGVDHVEREARPDLAQQRQQRVRHRAAPCPPAPMPRPDPVARAVDGQAVPALLARQRAQRRIMGMERQRPERQADRRHHLDLDIVARRERARLPLDEHAEGRACAVREQGREGQDAQHGGAHSKAGLRTRH